MTILDEAAKLTSGDRQQAYGHPADNHGRTADYWTNYLHAIGVLAPNCVVTAEDVCMLNILQKVSRESNSHRLDNLVDIAGYARNIEMIREPRAPSQHT